MNQVSNQRILELSSLNGTNGFAINGISAFDQSGGSVSSAGDVNGDGFDDLIIGAADASANGFYSGQSYVVFGKTGGFAATIELSTLNGINGFAINGINADDLSGFSVSGAGDVNGDGFDDPLIGANEANPNNYSFLSVQMRLTPITILFQDRVMSSLVRLGVLV